MTIKHAPWATGVPPVCTAFWGQESWDKFAESYRPAGYDGDIHDYLAYNQWAAQRHLEMARDFQHNPGGPIPPKTMVDVERDADLGRACGCGECLCCCILRALTEEGK